MGNYQARFLGDRRPATVVGYPALKDIIIGFHLATPRFHPSKILVEVMTSSWMNGNLVWFLPLTNISQHSNSLVGLEVLELDISNFGISHSRRKHQKENAFMQR